MMVTAYSTVRDLQIGGGGQHPDPEIREGVVSKNDFSDLPASVWSKNKGGPRASPGSNTAVHTYLQVNPHVSRCKSSHNAGPVG